MPGRTAFRRSIVLVAGTFLLLAVTACFDVDVDLKFQPDGSGEATVHVTVAPSVPNCSEVAAKVRDQLKESHWQVTERKQQDGTIVEIATKSFKTLSEIGPDLDLSGQVDSRSLGFLRSRTILNLTSQGGAQFSHYVITVTVPGKVLNTNGERTASNRVKWDLTGHGVTTLTAVSEGVSIPGPTEIFGEARVALADWIRRLGNSDRLLLNDDEKVLLANPTHPGRAEPLLTPPVASFSCSGNGLLAICFKNAGGIKVVPVQNPTTTLVSIPGDVIQPFLSRDATRLAYVRVLSRYSVGQVAELPEGVRAEVQPGSIRATEVVLRDLGTGAEIVAPTRRGQYPYGFSDLILGWADGSRMLNIHRFPVAGIDEGAADLWDTDLNKLQVMAGGTELRDGSIFQCGEGGGAILRPGHTSYMKVNADNEDVVDEPSVSPDGSMVAFTVERRNLATNSRQMVLRLWSVSSKRAIDLDKLEVNTNSPSDPFFGGLAWTSDSRILAYVTGNNQSSEIWCVNANGAIKKQRVLGGLEPVVEGSMLFLRDSRRLIFAEGASPHTSVVTVDIRHPKGLAVLARHIKLVTSFPNAPFGLTVTERIARGTADTLATVVLGTVSVFLFLVFGVPLLFLSRRLLGKKKTSSPRAGWEPLAPAAKFCEDCGGRLKPGARFCESCGAAVERH